MDHHIFASVSFLYIELLHFQNLEVPKFFFHFTLLTVLPINLTLTQSYFKIKLEHLSIFFNTLT